MASKARRAVQTGVASRLKRPYMLTPSCADLIDITAHRPIGLEKPRQGLGLIRLLTPVTQNAVDRIKERSLRGRLDLVSQSRYVRIPVTTASLAQGPALHIKDLSVPGIGKDRTAAQQADVLTTNPTPNSTSFGSTPKAVNLLLFSMVLLVPIRL